jgi:Dolichyl-phosphate-mannose-protein mannosyltransferase
MAIVLIFVSFLSALGAFYLKETVQERFRIAFLKAFIIHGFLTVVSTEALSLTRSLDFNHVALLWLAISTINLILAWRSYQPCQTLLSILSKVSCRQFSFYDWLSFTTVSIILLASLFIAVMAPPNNWDSMTYHMPRVMHWIQNQTVAHYPTNDLRQISFAPGASFLVAHLQILSGNDRFANCVQWLAFLGSLLGISLITKILVDKQAQWISTLVCASIPMAIAQSTTTQTDLVVTVWLVCLSYFFLKSPINLRADWFWIAASASLAIVTKLTAIIFGVPLLLFFSIRLFFNSLNLSGFNFVKAGLITSCVSLSILVSSVFLSLPNFVRNYQTFGVLLGPSMNTKNEIYGILPLISNILKNLCLNFTVPGFPQLAAFIHPVFLGTDVNDTRLSFPSPSPFFTGSGSQLSALRLLVPHEDKVANPIHLILAGIACWYLFSQIKFGIDSRKRGLILLQASTIAGFLMFCILLKWQVWGNRLLLPLFVLQTPISAYFLSQNPSILLAHSRVQWRKILLILLSVIAIFYSLTSVRHPIISLASPLAAFSDEPSVSILQLHRGDIYFSGSHKDLKLPYQQAVEEIVANQCQRVGFASLEDDWEYPLWVLLNSQPTSFRFKHVQVQNESNKLPPEFPDAELCAIVDGKGKVRVLTQSD